MKKPFLSIVLLMTFLVASVRGGVVSFHPQKDGLGPEGGQTAFDVFLSVAALDEFDAAHVVFGSDTLVLDSFAYAPSFVDASTWVAPPTPAGVYFSELFARGFAPAPYGSALVPFGTLTVTAPPFDPVAGTPNQHTVFVDSGRDARMSSLILGVASEELSGSATVNVAPEPPAIVLLALAMLALVPRVSHRRCGGGRLNMKG